MKKSILLTAALLAACSQRDTSQPQREQLSPNVRYEPSTDVSENAAAPGVDVTAAPGVAFDYRYAFRLPANKISEVQEAHAQACEKLGIDKCRITGMRYRLVDQKDVEAMLALRLDPKLARQFGKDATGVVQKSDGMLVDQEITGEDVGSRIAGAEKSEAQLRDELRRIEDELSRKVPMIRGNVAPQAAVDRQSLLDRAEEIRRQLRELGERKDSDKEALAGTPMVFNYGSGSVVPGFDVRSPLRDALQTSGDNFIGGFAAILVIALTLLPWLLVAGLGVWLFRRARRRWGWFPSGYRSADLPLETPPPPRRRKAAPADEV
ncbi:MAG TPA: hypothetical protein VF079_11450 [Sphingomicrobium sp.]